ncbi:GntR domain protein (plasmid) [Gemmatirosa kalamazoonensis]|uniref:GntR domain protein n=1 Tax=Gemmatirosa kalamazoonensis TaxID=861299 RepID=W0RPW9_9BACT|nr:GntR family transcriptional regulator [Gemmatirosa kalamazoonensis]AHG92385.1 GntR domain protein [Gemmatirosa kalamazoonensis]
MPATRRSSPEARPPVPLPRQTLTGMTLDAIRERILSGAYPEGEPLRQDAIAAELGVSRVPIREALRQLEAEGLAVFSPHRGAVVSSLSLDEIDEVFALRADIEPVLLRRAVPRLDAAALDRAAEVLDRYEYALRVHDVLAYGELNWQFHSTLYDAADRPVTLGVVQRLHQQCDRYLRMQLALTHGEHRASGEHRAILDAARRRDVRRAAALLREHVLGAGRSLLDFLGDHRAAGTGAAVTGAMRAPRSHRGNR